MPQVLLCRNQNIDLLLGNLYFCRMCILALALFPLSGVVRFIGDFHAGMGCQHLLNPEDFLPTQFHSRAALVISWRLFHGNTLIKPGSWLAYQPVGVTSLLEARQLMEIR